MQGSNSETTSPCVSSLRPNATRNNQTVQSDQCNCTSGGVKDSQIGQHQSNQVESSGGNCQTRSGNRKVKLSEAERRENKRLSDEKYRQKRKKIEENLVAENNSLKVENERFKDEIRRLTEDVRWLQPDMPQLQSEARPNRYVSKSASHLLNHKGAFVQDHQAMDLGAVDRISILELDHDLENLQKIEYVTENKENSQSAGTCYDNTAMTELLAKIEADDESRVKLSDFTGLDGDRERVGKYSFPLSLVSTVKRIIDIHGDISVTTKISTTSSETIYILFCASLKEMDDTQLDQLTDDRMLLWRDAIKDALRVNFKVDFAVEHLKKIAHAYIGRIESQGLEIMTERISKLEADLNTRKEELAKRKGLSKRYMDAAEEFNGKSLSPFP